MSTKTKAPPERVAKFSISMPWDLYEALVARRTALRLASTSQAIVSAVTAWVGAPLDPRLKATAEREAKEVVTKQSNRAYRR